LKRSKRFSTPWRSPCRRDQHGRLPWLGTRRAIAKRLGLPGPDPAVTLICQHKYLARVEQAKIVPDAVPPFALIEVAAPLPRGLRFPLFVKPVKSFFSIGAERVDSASALAALFPRWAALDPFFAPLEEMLQRHTGLKIGTKRLIAEGLLKGEQVTVEGSSTKVGPPSWASSIL
jgi:hypothetical protein